FDLSPLFEREERVEKEELRFATTRPASSVISKLEEVAKTKNFSVKKSDSCVRLQGKRVGGKEAGIAGILRAVAWRSRSWCVEVNENLGHNQSLSKELRRRLKTFVWTSTTGNTVPA
ncbi:UNVERIFIED_CONTAM: CBL-interacting serine/threonine-protein kinase, partial [Sesamum radiatum]